MAGMISPALAADPAISAAETSVRLGLTAGYGNQDGITSNPPLLNTVNGGYAAAYGGNPIRPRGCQDVADLSDPVFDPPRPFYETIRPAACGPFVPQPGDSVAIEPDCDLHPPSREWDGLLDCGPSLFGRVAILRDNVVDRLTPPWHRRGLHSRRSGRGSLRAVRKRWLGTLGHALRVRGVKP